MNVIGSILLNVRNFEISELRKKFLKALVLIFHLVKKKRLKYLHLFEYLSLM